MLWAILLVMWMVGMVTSNTMGGLIHILLVISVMMFLEYVVAERQNEQNE